MDRMQRSALLVGLMEALQSNNSWCGETHIQKAVYCLQEIRKVPTEFDFILYKHGPFSFDLRDELTAMRVDGLIRMRTNAYPFGPSLLPTERGKTIRSRYPQTIQQFQKAINYIAEALGSKGVAELERLATALYVTHEKTTLRGDVDERASLIHKLKPHVSLPLARSAVYEIDKLLARES